MDFMQELMRGGLWILPAAMMIDGFLGDPEGFYHPVVTVGKIISLMENGIRKLHIKRFGGLVLVITILFFVFFALRGLIEFSGRISPWLSTAVMIYFTYAGLAGKCLEVEALKVYDSLKRNGLSDARRKIGYLVGRETDRLDEEEIVKATVETVAENTIDGILAPVFYWFIGYLLGYPVEFLWLYKGINTLDSMVGYHQEPYRDIGYCPAKLDDLANFIPARLGSLFMIAFGGRSHGERQDGFRVFLRDRKAHKSPNAGHPEAVAAGILGIQLGGSNVYFGGVVEKPTIGDDRAQGKPEHILQALGIMRRSMWSFTMFLLMVTGFLMSSR